MFSIMKITDSLWEHYQAMLIMKCVPLIYFHMDTADFNAVGVNPQIIENYDGESTIVLDAEERYTLNTKDFPNLKIMKATH